MKNGLKKNRNFNTITMTTSYLYQPVLGYGEVQPAVAMGDVEQGVETALKAVESSF